MSLPDGITTKPISEYYKGFYEETDDMVGEVYYHQGNYFFECQRFENSMVIDWHCYQVPTVDQVVEHIKNCLVEVPSWYVVASTFEIVPTPSKYLERPYIYLVQNLSLEQIANDLNAYWSANWASIHFLGYGLDQRLSFWFNRTEGNWGPRIGVTLHSGQSPKQFLISFISEHNKIKDKELIANLLKEI